MIPSADLFEPLPIKAVGAALRAARFPADAAAPYRGVCVLLNGQTEFIEKYFEVIDELRGRGFAVASLARAARTGMRTIPARASWAISANMTRIWTPC